MSSIDWPISNAELARLLGLTERTIRVKQHHLRHLLIEGEDFDRADLGVKYSPTLMTVWNKSGAIKLALRSRQAKARAFLERVGVVEGTVVADESRTLDVICAALDGITCCRTQYAIGPYRVDLYLPELRIAVECDERGHKSYSEYDERAREQWIFEQLACEFLRYDPSDPAAIGTIINNIYQRHQRDRR